MLEECLEISGMLLQATQSRKTKSSNIKPEA